jgi:hypothetical protein
MFWIYAITVMNTFCNSIYFDQLNNYQMLNEDVVPWNYGLAQFSLIYCEGTIPQDRWEGSVVGSCEHSNELSVNTKVENLTS